jgi:hypothetical protein
MIKNISLLTCLILATSISGKDLYVAQNGNDANVGSEDKPFRTLKAAIKQAKPGDTCILRAGSHFVDVDTTDLKGAPGKPIMMAPFPGENVVIDGTKPIVGKWTEVSKGVFRTTLTHDVWQVFVDGKGGTLARWPNANVEDGSTFKHENYGEADRKKSTKEFVYDERLVATGIDFTGATVVAIGNNNVHRVAKHSKGAKTFTLDPFVKRWRIGSYSLEGKMCLDIPNEWWFDKATKELFLVVEPGKTPDQLDIRGKVQSFAFQGERTSYLSFRNLTFFGTTFHFLESDHIHFEDCLFTYPCHNKRVLGINKFDNGTMHAFDNERGGNGFLKKTENIVRNCEFRYADGSALVSNGYGDVIENNYFHHIGFNGLERYAVNMTRSYKSTFRRNTVHTIAGYTAVLPGQYHTVELNDCYDGSTLTHESTLIHVFTGNQTGININRNWTHDSITGIRFDTPNNGQQGFDGDVNTNVIWNCTRMIIKGDRHKVSNNTVFDCDESSNDIIIHDTEWKDNANSVIHSNASDTISGHRSKQRNPKDPFPGKQYNNWIGVLQNPPQKLNTLLRDPQNLDFRPKPGSVLETKGIGAYKAQVESYWIPGRKVSTASMPIPPNGSKTVKAEATLFWLDAYKSARQRLYFGTDRTAIANASTNSLVHRGVKQKNHYTPKNLESGSTYFWRIDSVRDGKTVKGPIWTFTVK